MAIGGMGDGRTWVLKIVADVRDAQKGMQQVETGAETFGQKAAGVGRTVVAALATGAVIEFGRSVVNAASETQQSLGAARSVFGQFSGDMEAFADSAATNLGVSNAETLKLTSLMGSLMKNAGVPLEQVADSTQTLTTRAADLAAMYGGNVSDAVNAVNSALKGEYDPLESFGVSLKASTVSARAMAEGYVDAEGKVTAAGMAIAAQELILEQSADAAGTFAKEGDTLAGQAARMQAEFADLQAELGTALLPVLKELFEVVRPLLTFIKDNAGWLVPLVGILGGIVLAVKAWTAAQWLWNAAMAANPIGLIVIAVAALIAAIVLLVQNWDVVKEAVVNFAARAKEVIEGFVSWLGDFFKQVFEIITYPYRMAWEIYSYFVGLYIDIWKHYISMLKWIFEQVFNIITWPFKQAWGIISGIKDQIIGAFKWMVENIKYWWGQIYDIITWPFRRAMDAIKWLWNTTIGGFGFTVPSWIPFIGGRDFRIPRMAAGGIVTRPTIALIGEAGPEAVIPLSQAGGMGTTIINVYALDATAEVGRRVYQALREYERTSGKAIA